MPHFCKSLSLHLCRLERHPASVIGQHCEGFPAPVQHLAQGRPELSGHEAVEEEVGGAVDEGEHVHDVSQRVVALLVELHPVDGREETQSSLHLELQSSAFYLWGRNQIYHGGLSNEEETKEGYEKPCRPVRAPRPPCWTSPLSSSSSSWIATWPSCWTQSCRSGLCLQYAFLFQRLFWRGFVHKQIHANHKTINMYQNRKTPREILNV